MIEIPESNTLANQMNETIKGKKVVSVIANNHPHKFAFLHEDGKEYNDFLKGKLVGETITYGGQIKTSMISESTSQEKNRGDDEETEVIMVLSEDINVRYIGSGEEIPEKHQLLIKFEDFSAFVVSARMYAQIHVSLAKDYKNEYFDAAKEKPSPLSDDFDMNYFEKLLSEVRPTSSVKAFLATKQRIPGLGNGTLQDILFNAKINPRAKIKKLSEKNRA